VIINNPSWVWALKPHELSANKWMSKHINWRLIKTTHITMWFVFLLGNEIVKEGKSRFWVNLGKFTVTFKLQVPPAECFLTNSCTPWHDVSFTAAIPVSAPLIWCYGLDSLCLNTYAEILTLSSSGCDCIWRSGFFRGEYEAISEDPNPLLQQGGGSEESRGVLRK
jgi:hypothetical protein